MNGIRFVVVATMLRGAVARPEVLDDANQWRAFSAWRMDESRDVRAEFEAAADDARVVWSAVELAQFERYGHLNEPGYLAKKRMLGISRAAREMRVA